MKSYFILLLLTIPVLLSGQSRASIGILPEVNVSYRWAEKWRITGQLESMQRGWVKEADTDLNRDYQYIRTDATAVLTLRLSPFWSTGVGYMMRFSEGRIIHRGLQQISSAHQYSGIRLGHRIRTDQTYASDESPEYRWRYRFSLEFPLNGQSLNNDEWYGIVSNEHLASLQSSEFDWEQRVVLMLGRYFNSKHKVEAGFDYRLDRFIREAPRHRLWFAISYFVNL